ncbi:MAG: hypothetical protein J7K53_00455 [Bacteroidales bacterium]|nr:hypothetical protein [Bacteroidales bacterium]
MKFNLRRILVVLFLITGLSFVPCKAHKFYVSLVRIEQNIDSNSFEITFKIFTDDLENTLEFSYNENLRIGTKWEHEKTDSILWNYLEKHFGIWVNGTKKNLAFIGKEVELDVTWCYIEVLDLGRVETISVFDDMLIELFIDQVNIVQANYEEVEKSLLLKRGKTKGTIEFD